MKKPLTHQLLLIALLAGIAFADAPPPTLVRPAGRPPVAVAPTTRPAIPAAGPTVATPRSIADLRKMEAQVQSVVNNVLPAVVGVSLGSGQGSGVIVSKDGLVLTAGHVTGDVNKNCTVLLPDGRRLKAKSLGLDRNADSGMLQITDKGEFPFVEVGKSADLKSGQWCLAIGHPGGFRPDRPPVVRLGRLLGTGKYLTTDCTIVGGDSGGPLFDLSGKVIGIHSRIGQSLLANMHVPVDVYNSTWTSLVAGEVKGAPGSLRLKPAKGSPYLGITGSDDFEDRGCVVEEVTPGSPAAAAGLKRGDLITRFDGKSCKSLQTLIGQITKKKVNDQVEIEILRDNKPLKLSVKIAAAK